MLKKMFLWITLVVIMVSLVGCQTIQGVGRDLEWLGGKTTETAGGFSD
jgi:predicted small secreted protein